MLFERVLLKFHLLFVCGFSFSLSLHSFGLSSNFRIFLVVTFNLSLFDLLVMVLAEGLCIGMRSRLIIDEFFNRVFVLLLFVLFATRLAFLVLVNTLEDVVHLLL